MGQTEVHSLWQLYHSCLQFLVLCSTPDWFWNGRGESSNIFQLLSTRLNILNVREAERNKPHSREASVCVLESSILCFPEVPSPAHIYVLCFITQHLAHSRCSRKMLKVVQWQQTWNSEYHKRYQLLFICIFVAYSKHLKQIWGSCQNLRGSSSLLWQAIINVLAGKLAWKYKNGIFPWSLALNFDILGIDVSNATSG